MIEYLESLRESINKTLKLLDELVSLCIQNNVQKLIMPVLNMEYTYRKLKFKMHLQEL